MTARRQRISSSSASGKRVKKRRTDHELDSVHTLATDAVSEVTEEELSNEGSNGSRNLESEILVRGEGSLMRSHVVDVSDHADGQVDSEDVVRIYRREVQKTVSQIVGFDPSSSTSFSRYS